MKTRYVMLLRNMERRLAAINRGTQCIMSTGKFVQQERIKEIFPPDQNGFVPLDRPW
jgi:hypothetical protein